MSKAPIQILQRHVICEEPAASLCRHNQHDAHLLTTLPFSPTTLGKAGGTQLSFTMHTTQLFSESKEMEQKSECKVNTSLPKSLENNVKTKCDIFT